MFPKFGFVTLAVLPASVLSFSSVASAEFQFTPVALSGATGTARGLGPNVGAGVDFLSLTDAPTLNEGGKVAFSARLVGTGVTLNSDNAVFSNANGAVTLLAREGATPNGLSLPAGVKYNTITSSALSDDGVVTSQITLAGTGITASNDGAIASISPNGMASLIMREGSAVPDPNLAPGVVALGFGWLRVDPRGKTSFLAYLTGPGIDSTNDQELFTNAGGDYKVVSRTGTTGPGPAGETLSFIQFTSFNRSGDTVYMGILPATHSSGRRYAGLFRADSSGGVTTVMRNFGAGPSPNVGAGVDFSGFGEPSLNAAGQVAFYAGLIGTGISTSNDRGMFLNSGGAITTLAREGPSGPGPNVGPGVEFFEFDDPYLNAAGKVAFQAYLKGTGVTPTNDTLLAVTTAAGGAVIPFAREGDDGALGPQLGEGVTFGDLFAPNLTMNGAGDVVVQVSLAGTGVTGANNKAIYIYSNGALQKLVRSGDVFDVDPGPGVDLRTVASAYFGGGSAGDDGQFHSFNDDGLLALSISFTDGSSGVFTTVVPEPVAASIVAAGAALLAVLRGRVRCRA